LKTYVFDAGALFALLQQTPATQRVHEIIKEALRGHCRALMSTVNHGEVYGLLLRSYSEGSARQVMSAVSQLPIELHDVTPQRGLQAAEIKIRYKLYYVDSFAAALAIENKATLVTSDSDFRKLGHSVPILWLKSGT
jgi:predicted nucleic acid-binding protein